MKLYKLKIRIGLLLFLSFLLNACTEQTKRTDEKSSRVSTLPYYSEATFTPHWLEAKSDDLKDFHKISNFKLINQERETITEKSLDDKIYVADFFFATCPGICPKMTENMKILQEAFLEDSEIMLISHSVTPERDTVEVLKKYGEERGIDSKKWYLLTGDREQIYKLGRKDYFIEEDLGLQMEEDDFLHTENFVLIDKNKHLRGIYNGLKMNDIKQLIADINTLKKEKQ